ncbi:MAG TPA: thiolase family protein [Rhodothermales bacterium]|nr:thiolase family protein [Rhodothermales bacterium]
MQSVYIVSAVRTPIGKFGGSFKDQSPSDLAAHTMKAALERASVKGGDLDLYLFGNVLRAGHGQLIPRQAAIKAGIPEEIDGAAVDMVCSSGMMSIIQAAAMIKAGDAGLILAGGTECMSNTGFFLSARARWGYKFLLGAPEQLTDLMLLDGLTDPLSGEPMGIQAERVAREHGVTREELDHISATSHKRADEATRNGWFRDEIVPYPVTVKGKMTEVTVDEGIRPDTTVETLSGLRPAFEKEGVMTAGNSSQISDGACAVLIAGEDAVKRHGLKPLARLVGNGWAAGPSWRFPEATIPAVQRLLDRVDMEIGDFDLVENNEAFAINSILLNRNLCVPYEKLNVHGGAIALGHPIGASGARVVTTLVHALKQHDKQTGLAAICHGTGGGTAVAVERV